MPSLRERPEFALGRSGEKLVAGWLQGRGWFVIPSYDYAGEDGKKAPRMQGFQHAFAIPDLDVGKHGDRIWVEVKTKTDATLHKITGIMEHGIAKRLYDHYQQVEYITGTPVWLVIVEVINRLLVGQQLKILGKPRIYRGDKMDVGGTVFWPQSAFKRLSRIPAETGMENANG